MTEHQFENLYAEEWRELKSILDKDLGRHADSKLPTDYPQRYRRLCRHLSLARSRHYSAVLIEHLEDLALKGQQSLYRSRTNILPAVAEFLYGGFARHVRREWKAVTLSSLLFWLPLFLCWIIVYLDPHKASMFLDPAQLEQMKDMYDPAAEHFGEPRPADSDLMMWAFYIKNNVSIDFYSYAGGLLFGLGSIFFMVFNGMHIGVIGGYLNAEGFGSTFNSFVSGHSSLELIAATISGAAGLKLGQALIKPGQLTRLEALRKEASSGVKLLYGAAFMTFLAAFIEAFWSSRVDIPNQVKYIFGASLWAMHLFYFTFAGRRRKS